MVTVAKTVVPEIHDLAQANAPEGGRDMSQLPGRSAPERMLPSDAKVDGASKIGPAVSMPVRATVALSPTTNDDVHRLPREEHVVASLPHSLLESAAFRRPRLHDRPKIVAPSGETTPPPSGHAEVDVDELKSRIAGINLSLQTLEGELSVKKNWSADQLDALVQRLDILILRQKIWPYFAI